MLIKNYEFSTDPSLWIIYAQHIKNKEAQAILISPFYYLTYTEIEKMWCQVWRVVWLKIEVTRSLLHFHFLTVWYWLIKKSIKKEKINAAYRKNCNLVSVLWARYIPTWQKEKKNFLHFFVPNIWDIYRKKKKKCSDFLFISWLVKYFFRYFILLLLWHYTLRADLRSHFFFLFFSFHLWEKNVRNCWQELFCDL